MFLGRNFFVLLPFSPLIASISPSCASSITIRVKHFLRLALNSFVYKTKLIFIRLINSIFYFIYAFDSRARELALWQKIFFFFILRHTCDAFFSSLLLEGKFTPVGRHSELAINIPGSLSMLHKQRHLMKKFSEIISPFFLCVGFEPFARERDATTNDNDSHRCRAWLG